MGRVCVLQHAPCEPLGTIADALRAAGHTAETVRTFEGQAVPEELGEAGGVILMGGPMSVYEQAHYPFLKGEMKLIEEALRTGKPVLGVCLGSQLLAAALGADVRPGRKKEIGWYPVSLSEAARNDPLFTGVKATFLAYHWHGDVFDLPRGAKLLASSEVTACQAFRYGPSAYGLLFHAEVTRPMVAAMVHSFSQELAEAAVLGTDVLRDADAYLPLLRDLATAVFGKWALLIAESDH